MVFLCASCGADLTPTTTSASGSTTSSGSTSSLVTTTTADAGGGSGSSTTDSGSGGNSGATTASSSSTTYATTTSSTTSSTTTTSTTTPTTMVMKPTINSFTATGGGGCPVPGVTFVPTPVPVVVSWSVSNADSVYIAIDNVDGPYETNLALTGTRELPWGCPGPHTYYVVAKLGTERAEQAITIGG